MIKNLYEHLPLKSDKYEIEYVYEARSTVEIHIELTVKQLTGDQKSLSIRLGNKNLTFSSQLAETEAANRLRSLIQQITICVPNSWYDQSRICDGFIQDLKINFGYNVLHFNWFSGCPPEWETIEALANEIWSVAYNLKEQQPP